MRRKRPSAFELKLSQSDGGNATAEDILGLDKGNLIFCFKGSRENCFEWIGRQGNNNLSFRAGTFKNNIDHRGQETCAMLGLPIYNKSSAVNVLLTKLSFFNIRFILV